MDLRELLDACQVQAISNKIQPNEASHWRYLCRRYSEAFCTPLHIVKDLDPEFVILNVYEKELQDMDTSEYENLDKLLDAVMSISDPEYDAKKSKELDNLVSRFEEEDEQRVKEGKGIPKVVKKPKKSLLENPKSEPEKKTQSGGVDLSHLDNENER